MIKLLIGGSPCTYWSIAQTKNRETEPNGIGWDLFENYLIALRKHNSDYFLYENNYSMDGKIRDEITKRLGVKPIMINSALVSAQNRKRYYWTNIPNVEQPEDKKIFLKDILESGVPFRNEKAYCLDASYYRGANYSNFDKQSGKIEQYFEARTDGKTNALTTVQKDNAVAEPIRIGTIESNAQNPDYDSKQYRVYSPYGKSVTLCGNGGGLGTNTGLYAVPTQKQLNGHQIYRVSNGNITINDKTYPIKLPDGYYIIRKLSVTECKRLQTVPDSYKMPCSKSQNYKMLGNGWTVDVIQHILSHIPDLDKISLQVLSMYDGMSCGHIALDKLNADITEYYATEIDKYAIRTTLTNYPQTIYLGDAFNVRNKNFKIAAATAKIDRTPIKKISGEQISLF